MEGVLTNVDRDLQRHVNWSDHVQDADHGMWMTTINLMMRFAINSYHAVVYIAGDEPEDSRRRRISLGAARDNRQLLDLLFSLVYILDDFPARCVDYQRSGWREFHEEYTHWYTHFGSDAAWHPFLNGLQEVLDHWEGPCRITLAEKSNPKPITYWKTPTQLKKKPTKSREYLEHLDLALWGHLCASSSEFWRPHESDTMLLAEIVGGQRQEEIENRVVLQKSLPSNLANGDSYPGHSDRD